MSPACMVVEMIPNPDTNFTAAQPNPEQAVFHIAAAKKQRRCKRVDWLSIARRGVEAKRPEKHLKTTI